ncbi:MAG: PIG-L family deacetylase [Deltaproteobacteria bacterium]|nr:PIG-L family deacetylase [Deltaproteobacteria bacterium]
MQNTSEKAKKTVLVIAAHPDDEVLGCGGTIARLGREGWRVYIAILGEGITSRYDHPEHADKELLRQLHVRSQEVVGILGATDVRLYNLPDNRFDTVPMLDIVKIVENMVENIKPQIVYTHSGGDLNVDHAVTHRAVLTATRPMPSCLVKDIYAFEVPSSTEWAFSQFQPVFLPNMFVDIRDTLDIKIRAMQHYEGESRTFPHPRSPEALRSIAQNRGAMVGVEYAEAFCLIRSVA